MPNLNTIHVRDLNFVIRSEIFFHYGEQLKASHLILCVTPVYTNYQSSRKALIVGSPLLSYINVWHRGFFPRRLTVGEPWDLGPRLIRVGSLVPTRDGSANTVFQGRVVHTPVEEQRKEVPTTEQTEVDSIDSLGAEAKNTENEMVFHRNMTTNYFLPSGCPAM